jgi:putative hydrolase of the HAD superfamily
VIRAVLFDAVGTLIHLREPVGDTYARIAGTCGIRVEARALTAAFPGVLRAMPPMAFPGLRGDALRDAERGWWHRVVERVFAAAVVDPGGAQFERCFDALFAHFAGARGWRVADGAAELLAALRARGMRPGMISNFDHRLPAILDALGLAPLLDVVVLPGDAGAAKPDPRIFARALALLQVAPADAVYVGDDAEHDVAAARAAGLQAFDVTAVPHLRELSSFFTAMGLLC